MTRIKFLPVAKLEFRDAIRWYRGKNLAVATRFAHHVRHAVSSIRNAPELHSIAIDDIRIYLLRRFPYFIAYRYSDDVVIVIAIRHTSQDPDAWQGR